MMITEEGIYAYDIQQLLHFLEWSCLIEDFLLLE